MQSFFAEDRNKAVVDSPILALDPKFRDLLNANQFKELEDFMFAPQENSFRDVPGRLTVGLDLDDEGSKQRVYLKRHWNLSQKKSDAPFKEAFSEWNNLRILADAGINVPEALAYGHGLINGRSVAFIMMKEVPGMQADHFIERKLNKEYNFQDRSTLAKRIAELSIKFHEMGYNHRDFYLCHTFVNPVENDFELNLIDLQRVQHRKAFRKRWIVKDLAQMAYSSLKICTRTDRMRFYLKYSGSESLSAADKKFIASIDKKVATMVKREREGKVR